MILKFALDTNISNYMIMDNSFFTLLGGEKKKEKKRVKQLNRVVWTVRFAPMEEHP